MVDAGLLVFGSQCDAVSGLISAAVPINPVSLSIAALAVNAIGLTLRLLTGRAKATGAHEVIADETIIAE